MTWAGRAGSGESTAALLAVAALAAGLGILAYATHLLRRTELQTIDARFSIRGKQAPPSNIVLVQINNETLEKLRERHESLRTVFPFPRAYDARVIDHLREAGAKVIVMDIQFSLPTDERDDLALAGAIERAHGKDRPGRDRSRPRAVKPT